MKFSVLIAVHKSDNPKYFERAIKSIWEDQTLKPNQIVLVQDGPVGNQIQSVIEKFKIELGRNLSFLELPVNQGLANSLNKGIEICKYGLIARMDSDDISFPNRFEKQITFFANNDVDILGGQTIEFGLDIDDIISKRIVPLNHSDIVNFMKFRSPFSHPSIMIKKEVYLTLSGYDVNIGLFEDYDLFVRAYLKKFKFGNLNDQILWFRLGSDLNTIRRRRGIYYAINEFKVYVNFYKLGFYNLVSLIKVLIVKVPIRIIPFSFYKFIYFKLLR